MRGHFGDEPPTDTCENCGYGCRLDHRGLCAECGAADDRDGWVKLLAGMSPEAFARFDALCDVADGVTT